MLSILFCSWGFALPLSLSSVRARGARQCGLLHHSALYATHESRTPWLVSLRRTLHGDDFTVGPYFREDGRVDEHAVFLDRDFCNCLVLWILHLTNTVVGANPNHSVVSISLFLVRYMSMYRMSISPCMGCLDLIDTSHRCVRTKYWETSQSFSRCLPFYLRSRNRWHWASRVNLVGADPVSFRNAVNRSSCVGFRYCVTMSAPRVPDNIGWTRRINWDWHWMLGPISG